MSEWEKLDEDYQLSEDELYYVYDIKEKSMLGLMAFCDNELSNDAMTIDMLDPDFKYDDICVMRKKSMNTISVTLNKRIDNIINDFPQLVNHRDMVEFILDIREAFNLEKIPFEVKVGNWSSGSIEHYHKATRDKARDERLKKKKPKKQRPPNQPYTRHPGFKL